jgi:heme-degrading monooxygenase HmoA
MMRFREMDERVTYLQQLQEEAGPIVLINEFNVAPEDTERFLEVWADDAAYMKQQPGFISTQLHRGTAGSTTYVNVAVWESAGALGEAFRSPEFQERAARYPEEAVAAPHIFKRSPSQESAWRKHQPRRPGSEEELRCWARQGPPGDPRTQRLSILRRHGWNLPGAVRAEGSW